MICRPHPLDEKAVTTGREAYLPFREEFVSLCPEKYPPEYIDAMVWGGSWACWSNGGAAILAEVKQYPSGLREVHGLAAAGDVAAITGLIPLAEEWGRALGCSIASIESRPAWAKLLPEYEVEQVRIVKGLDNGA